MTERREPLMGIDELAAYLRLPNRQSVYWARYQGKCPSAVRVAGKLRWRQSDVDAWITSRTEPTQAS